jgi:hypothetical protein
MAYAFRRENKGTPSFTGVYEGPDGSRRSAGTFPSRRAALRAAQREEQAVREGRWRDRSLGDITFEAYVENSWFPSNTSRPRLVLRTGRTSIGTSCRSSAAGRWAGSCRRWSRSG